ncbi:hypothetical protein JCM9140_18 [Halalkalibacter wakoensis JCM 9140]|uniref:TcaA protein NTF2-like domain-containing protein n=1 Tax=Halalkalibacter wakoensis JCM 9140 TaxID=1236970 RepID=W4PYB8_9BACI|nr:hypothetical protein [Halalkalibacter wakoensis]GAE24114.1 hypothetical protein JCM9140_18 [Halalkalibacter wakoensis JCM 9140]
MKKITVLLLLFVFLATACSSSEPEQLTLLEGEEAEEVALFLQSYKEEMIHSVNTGDFNHLEPYLITNNSFYHSVRRYTSDLHGENTTKELNLFEVEAVYEDEIGELHADVNETVTINEHGVKNEVTRSLRFEIVRGGNDSLRIITIKARK